MVYIRGKESVMHISVTDAKAQLTDLVRRAEAGEEIILTRHGHAAVRLVPVRLRITQTAAERRQIIESIRDSVRGKALPGPDAAHSADYLYDENGLPK
jgi:prevent-host-death family protein